MRHGLLRHAPHAGVAHALHALGPHVHVLLGHALGAEALWSHSHVRLHAHSLMGYHVLVAHHLMRSHGMHESIIGFVLWRRWSN